MERKSLEEGKGNLKVVKLDKAGLALGVHHYHRPDHGFRPADLADLRRHLGHVLPHPALPPAAILIPHGKKM